MASLTALILFLDEHGFYLVRELDARLPEDFHMEKSRFSEKPRPGGLLCRNYRASSFDWYETHRYCGRCGKPFRHSKRSAALFATAADLGTIPGSPRRSL